MSFRIKTVENKEQIKPKAVMNDQKPIPIITLHSKDIYTEEQAEVINIRYNKRKKNDNKPITNANMEEYRKNLIGEEKPYPKEVIIYDPILKKWKLMNV